MPKPASEAKQLEWKGLIEEQSQSGLSVRSWCLQKKIPIYTFHYWKEKLFPAQLKKSHFAELKPRQAAAISIQAPGIFLRIGGDCNSVVRKQILAFFAEGVC